MLIKALTCKPLDHARLALSFTDGSAGVADISEMIALGGAMIAPLSDPVFFARVFLEAGAPTWPNGFDLAPWALHADLKAAGQLEPASQNA
ncbi:MAG: DUF2442 domain-containing protein [Oceanicaulis sp.]|jgi:hypothetical protein